MRGGKFLSAILFTVVVGLSFVYANGVQAAADNVSAISLSLTSSTVSATGVTATVTLTTTGTLASGTEIASFLSSSAGSFTTSGVSASDITSTTMTGTGSVVSFNGVDYFKFTLSSSAAAGTHTIAIADLTNPSTAGTASITLSTTGLIGLSGSTTSTASTSISSGSDSGEGSEGGGDEGSFGGDFSGGESITGDNTIAVTVTDEANAAIASETVMAFCGMSYTTGTTDSSGIATITDLADGNCGVWVSSNTNYSDTSYFSFATDGTAKSQSVALTTIALDGIVELTLTDPNGDAVSNAYVTITSTSGQAFSGATDSSGVVELGVVYGTYTLDGYLSTDSNLYFIPDTSFTVSSSGLATDGVFTLNVQLESFTSFITGTVVAASTGAALSTPQILAYNDSEMVFTAGNSDGTYSVGVHTGTYTVKGEKSGYANASLSDIAVSEGETTSGQTITLPDAGNTLNLTTVDADGADLLVSGYLFCKDPLADYDPSSVYFRQITAGSATFTFPDGDFQCTSFVTGYVSSTPTFTMAGDETEAGDMILTAYNSTLAVTLEDADGNTLSNARYGVIGTSTDGNALNGYSLGGATEIGAIAGTYTVRAFVMGGGYTSDYNDTTTVTLTEGDTTEVTLTVYSTSATLSGAVTNSDGQSVDGATVTVSCVKSNGKTFDFTTQADTAGAYTVDVVPGNCTLNAASPDGTELPSGDATESVSSGDTVDHDLQLKASNANLVVTPSAQTVDTGSCYAYNADGIYVTADIDVAEHTATLPVRAGEWSYGCRVISEDNIKVSSMDAVVSVKRDQDKAVDAAVGSAEDNFNTSVFQFTATSDNTLHLPDGTTIFVPANALANSGTVNITASVSTDVASEAGLAAGPAIELTAADGNGRQLTGNFNGNITIQFAYTTELLEKYGLTEDDLNGGYTYKRGALSVTDQGYTIDTDANTVTVTTNHFSAFTIAGAKTPAASAPSKPKSLKAKHILAKTAKLTWHAPSTGEVTKYKVQVRRHGVKKQSKWTTYKRVTKLHKLAKSLRTETRYQFRAKACNGALCSDYTKWEAFKTK